MAIVKLDKLAGTVEDLSKNSGISVERIRELCRGRHGCPRLFVPVSNGGIRLNIQVRLEKRKEKHAIESLH
jgi:hypothetical protein